MRSACCAGLRAGRPQPSSASCAAARWPTSIRMSSRPRSGGCCACATPAPFSFPAATPEYRRVPRHDSRHGRFPPHRCAVGQPADSHRDGVLLQSSLPGGSLRSIRARPVRPSRCCRSRPGTRSSPTTRCSPTLAPDVEALVVNRLGQSARVGADLSATIGPSTTSCRSINASGSSD